MDSKRIPNRFILEKLCVKKLTKSATNKQPPLGIFGADGEHWRWQRKLSSHIFNVNAFRSYTNDVFCQEAKLVIDFLSTAADSGKVVDLQNIFYLFTLGKQT